MARHGHPEGQSAFRKAVAAGVCAITCKLGVGLHVQVIGLTPSPRA